MPEEQNIGCKCTPCQDACKSKPGWFLPGEAEKLVDFFGLNFEEVFKKKLAVDWWEADDRFENDVFVLSPNVVGGDPGEEFDSDPNGVCVFYVNGECSIHEVKPFECAEHIHTESREEIAERHMGVARAWENEQDQIEELLGRKPMSSQYNSIFGMFM